ncbi:hypothetical protein FACS189431_1280 [Alphaproteobacteria bacterium]|nr:hypothetical protein FACS189431_1280 [Alphaproteobacteria bacterium]
MKKALLSITLAVILAASALLSGCNDPIPVTGSAAAATPAVSDSPSATDGRDPRFVQEALDRLADENGASFKPGGVAPGLDPSEKDQETLTWLGHHADALLGYLQSYDPEGWRSVLLADILVEDGSYLSDAGIKGWHYMENIFSVSNTENVDSMPGNTYNSGVDPAAGTLMRATQPGMAGTGRKMTTPAGDVIYIRDECLNPGVPGQPWIPEDPRLDPKSPAQDILANPGLDGAVADTTATTGSGHAVVTTPGGDNGTTAQPAPAPIPDSEIWVRQVQKNHRTASASGSGGYWTWDVWDIYDVYADGHEIYIGVGEGAKTWYPDPPPQTGNAGGTYAGDPGE